LDLFQDIFVFVLSVEIKCANNLFEQSNVYYLVSFARDEPLGTIKKEVKSFFLVLEYFCRFEMFLCHVGLGNICGLVTRHQVKIKH
jgi:hypothetical protein